MQNSRTKTKKKKEYAQCKWVVSDKNKKKELKFSANVIEKRFLLWHYWGISYRLLFFL